jgi:5-(carboxyamino)imidazole ribonucleotide mutase
MAKVGIVMGSDSDMPVMSKAADMLEKFGIEYEMTIISAHREPDVFFEYAKTAEEKGFKVQVWRHIFRVCVQRFSRCR